MRELTRLATAILSLLAMSTSVGAQTPAGEPEPWVAAMRDTHARFTGKPGTLALFGDSISVSLAFWAPLASAPRGVSPELAADLKLVNSHLDPVCWRDWRGAEFGNEGGMTIRWADENAYCPPPQEPPGSPPRCP